MKHKRFTRDLRTRAFIFALLVVMSLIIVIPYVWMLSNSFKTTMETMVDASHLLPKEPTLDGYKKVLFDSPFFKWLRNSLIIAITDTVIVLFTSSILGFVFARYQFRGKSFLFMLLMFTMMVPAQVTMIGFYQMVYRIHMTNQLSMLILPLSR